MLEVWDSDAGLEKFVVFPTRPGNAAAHFKRLEVVFQEEKDQTDIVGDSSGVLELLRAAEIADCRLSPDFYPFYESANSPQPEFFVLRSYLQALLDTAHKQEQDYGNPAEAERRYHAALICGWHLTNDKSTTLVYITGLLFKLRAAEAYEPFLRRHGRSAEARLMREYIARTGELIRLFHWKANNALGITENFTSLPAAVNIALNDKEKCWRADAVLKLAVFRHGAPSQDLENIHHNAKWEKTAEKALEQVASQDPDPSIRALTVWSVLNINPDSFAIMSHHF